MAFAVASLRPPFFPPVRIEPEQRKRASMANDWSAPECGKQFIHFRAKSPLGIWPSVRDEIAQLFEEFLKFP